LYPGNPYKLAVNSLAPTNALATSGAAKNLPSKSSLLKDTSSKSTLLPSSLTFFKFTKDPLAVSNPFLAIAASSKIIPALPG